MNRRVFVFTLVFALLALTAVSVWAAAGQSTIPNLVPTGVSIKPEVPYPGQEVRVTIGYENQGIETITETVQYSITVEGTDESKQVDGEHEVKGLTAKDTDTSRGELSVSFYAPVAEGTYRLDVTFNGVALEEPLYFVVETALPPEVARLFAGLGVFAAVMAIMAVGTEVVMEPFKSLLGLKQKVSALEALDQLRKELPGQLAGLGVDAASRSKINELFKGLETPLDWFDKALEPLKTGQEVYDAVKGGQLSKAFEEVKVLEAEIRALDSTMEPKKVKKSAEEKLRELKKTARTGVEDVLARLGARFKLDQATVDQVAKSLDELIDSITLESILAAADYTADLVGRVFKEIHERGPEWMANWLQAQADTYLTAGRSGVVELLDGELLPTLKDFGLADESVNEVRTKIVEQIDGFQVLFQEKAATYTLAVRNLLLAVETRRQEMQSPVRKIWRRLRKSDEITRAAAIAVLVFGGAGVVIALLPKTMAGSFLSRLLWFPDGPWRLLAMGVGLLLGVVVGAIVQWVFNDPVKLGDFLLSLEKGFNKLRGENQPPDKYGAIHYEDENRIKKMGPTSVAKVLLQQEDKHRDEETSRLRWLRVFSIIIGVVLAYWLRIDAAEYLGRAIPGIEEQINGVVDFAVWHERWAWIPEELTVGIVLTGLAAAAGSKFWRDLLSRLQAARGQAEEAARLVRQVKGMVGLEQQE
jgi:hypothetical protein